MRNVEKIICCELIALDISPSVHTWTNGTESVLWLACQFQTFLSHEALNHFQTVQQQSDTYVEVHVSIQGIFDI